MHSVSTSTSDFLNTVALPEITAIKVVLDLLLRSAPSFREVTIHFDIRVAIPDLSAQTVRLRLVKECLTLLSMASNHFVLRLVRVPQRNRR